MKNCFGEESLWVTHYISQVNLFLEYDGIPCTHKFKSEIQAGGRNCKYVCMDKKIWKYPLILYILLF